MHLPDILIAIVTLLAVTAVAVTFSKSVGLGSILGYLAAGVILGNFVMDEKVTQLREFAELGVVFLLFIIGLEMQPRRLWSMRRLVFGLGTAQVLVCGAAIAGIAMLFGESIGAAVIIGLGLALSSTAFVLQMIGERGDLATDHGQASFSVLLMQDLAIVPLLALVPIVSPEVGATDNVTEPAEVMLVLAVLGATFLVARFVLPLALAFAAKKRNNEAFMIISLLAVMGAALAMEEAELSMALGAFVVGMMLSASEYAHQVEASVEQFKGVLLALFFISVGMSVDPDIVAAQWLDLATFVTAVIVAKVVIIVALCMAFGLGRATSFRVGTLLCQCGEFGFVVFGAAVVTGLLSPEKFAFGIVAISVSMAATPLMTALGERLASGAEEGAPVDEAVEVEDRAVVVAGCGRFGTGVSLMLQKTGVPYVVFDRDMEAVNRARALGLDAHLGDMAQPATLRAAGVGRAAALVVTIDDAQAVARLISAVRMHHPDTRIIARARDHEAMHALYQQGVTKAVPETSESALALGSEVLQRVGVADDVVSALKEDARRADYAFYETLAARAAADSAGPAAT